MSDLLPLVLAAVNDKAAADAQEEIAELRKQLDVSRSVEIIRAADARDDDDAGDEDDDEVVVYASAQFQDGKYAPRNPHYLWQVYLKTNQEATCRLADLRRCRLCVGGGFPLASLDDDFGHREDYEAFIDPDEESDTDNSKTVSFRINSLWVVLVVHGWPRAEWEAVIEADDLAPNSVIEFLVETVALNHPEATIEFKYALFVVRTIPAVLKRLLPLKRKKEVEAERNAALLVCDSDEFRAYTDLAHFVQRTMRDRGNSDGSALFYPQCKEVMDILMRFGVYEHTDDNEEFIINVIATYERVGRGGVEEAIQEFRQLDEEDDDEESTRKKRKTEEY